MGTWTDEGMSMKVKESENWKLQDQGGEEDLE